MEKKNLNVHLALQGHRKRFKVNTVQTKLENGMWKSEFEQRRKHNSLFRSVRRFWAHVAKCKMVNFSPRSLVFTAKFLP